MLRSTGRRGNGGFTAPPLPACYSPAREMR
jgi:hypothetical protein